MKRPTGTDSKTRRLNQTGTFAPHARAHTHPLVCASSERKARSRISPRIAHCVTASVSQWVSERVQQRCRGSCVIGDYRCFLSGSSSPPPSPRETDEKKKRRARYEICIAVHGTAVLRYYARTALRQGECLRKVRCGATASTASRHLLLLLHLLRCVVLVSVDEEVSLRALTSSWCCRYRRPRTWRTTSFSSRSCSWGTPAWARPVWCDVSLRWLRWHYSRLTIPDVWQFDEKERDQERARVYSLLVAIVCIGLKTLFFCLERKKFFFRGTAFISRALSRWCHTCVMSCVMCFKALVFTLVLFVKQCICCFEYVNIIMHDTF